MKIFVWLFLWSPVMTFSQTSFTIKGDVKELKDGDKLYFSYRLNKVLYKDSTVSKDHTFVFTGLIGAPALGSISARENPFSNIDVLHDNLNFYVEPGNIMITGADSLKYAIADGTTNNRDYSELQKQLRPYFKEIGKLSENFDALPLEEQKNVDKIAANRVAYYNIVNRMNPVKFAFIYGHKESYISLVTLQNMLNQADINTMISAYKTLGEQLKNTPEGKVLGSRIAAAMKSRIGTKATDFSLPDKSGRLVRLSDYRGKYVLVDFWASWCTPCRKETPALRAAFERYRLKNFTIISVSIDEQNAKAAWLRAVKNDGMGWTQLLDATRKVHDLYGVTYIPANFLLDPTGQIIAVNLKDKALADKLNVFCY